MILYSLLLYLLLPFAFLRLWWRGRHNVAYRQRWPERLGFYKNKNFPKNAVWVHAVSVGETIAVVPLIKDLLAKNYPVVLTNMTITGSERAQALFGDKVTHCYLPYDLPFATRRFFKTIKPRLGIIMETEIWPNLYLAAEKNNIPLVLVNARLSEKSAKQYSYFPWIFRPTLNRLAKIAAQAEYDAQRFIKLGMVAERVSVMGNIKFALEVPTSAYETGKMLRQHMDNRLVWMAASTHKGEEEQILQAFKKVQEKFPKLLLLLVPRHPERFDQVAELLKQQSFTFVRRSQQNLPALAQVSVFLGDSMGEMFSYYAASDIAFVGGSLMPIGGHNVLEPAALSLPVVTGPHTFNFIEIMQLMTQAQACIQIQTAAELATVIEDLCAHPEKRQQMGQAGYEVIQANRKAPEKLWNILTEYLHESATH